MMHFATIPYQRFSKHFMLMSFCVRRHRPAAFTTFADHAQDKVRQYLTESLPNVDTSRHADIIQALQRLYGMNDANQLALELQKLSREDLQALVAATTRTASSPKNNKPKRRETRTLHVSVPHEKNNQSFELTWKAGESLLDLAKREPDTLGQYLEGSCGGNMGCCTCHVYIDDAATLQDALPEMEETEWDLLEMAYEPNEDSSRLGCQIRLTPKLLQLPRIAITIPAGVNNVWNEA